MVKVTKAVQAVKPPSKLQTVLCTWAYSFLNSDWAFLAMGISVTVFRFFGFKNRPKKIEITFSPRLFK
jgi:hypothetical protein